MKHSGTEQIDSKPHNNTYIQGDNNTVSNSILRVTASIKLTCKQRGSGSQHKVEINEQ